jgi:hypothetical protein
VWPKPVERDLGAELRVLGDQEALIEQEVVRYHRLASQGLPAG